MSQSETTGAASPCTPAAHAEAALPFIVRADALRDTAQSLREMLLAPIIPRSSLTLLYGPRGVGKTFLALSMALAVAGGGTVFDWRAKRPARVLYVDGEMPRSALLDRLARLAAGAGTMPAGDNFRLLASEGDGLQRPDLGTEEGRSRIEQALSQGVDLLVLDSLSMLVRNSRADAGRAWVQVENWLLALRRRGLAVLAVRNGAVGGHRPETTQHADVVDTAIVLRRPVDYEAFEGARFDLSFGKGRALLGTAAQPFEAALFRHDRGLQWCVSTRDDARSIRATGLFLEGYSVREVASRLGVSKSEAQRLRSEAMEQLEKDLPPADRIGTVLGRFRDTDES